MWSFGMIGIVLAVIIVILVLGTVLKLAKVAIIVALIVGGHMFLQGKLGNKRIK